MTTLRHPHDLTPALPEYFHEAASKNRKRSSYPLHRRTARPSGRVAVANQDEQCDNRQAETLSYWHRRWLASDLSDLDLIFFRRFFGVSKQRFDKIVERARLDTPESSRQKIPLALKILTFLDVKI